MTLDVLAEKIDNLCERVDEMKKDSHSQFERLSKAEGLNTEFRQKAVGAVGVASIVSGVIGAFFVFILGKIWK